MADVVAVDLKLGPHPRAGTVEALPEDAETAAILEVARPNDDEIAGADCGGQGRVLVGDRVRADLELRAELGPSAREALPEHAVQRSVTGRIRPGEHDVAACVARCARCRLGAKRNGYVVDDPHSAARKTRRQNPRDWELVRRGASPIDPKTPGAVIGHAPQRLIEGGIVVNTKLGAEPRATTRVALAEDAEAGAVLVGAVPDHDEASACQGSGLRPGLIVRRVRVHLELGTDGHNLRS